MFHTESFDDILNVTDPTITTRGYFLKAGNSLRQGVEASLRYQWERLTFNGNYAYVDARFLSNLTLPSGRSLRPVPVSPAGPQMAAALPLRRDVAGYPPWLCLAPHFPAG